MKKSVLVIGLGRFGRGVIEELHKRGHDIFAINKDEEPLNSIQDKIVSGAIFDVAADDDELARIVGEKNFDEAVVAMGEDFEGTLIATHVLKEAGIRVSVKAANQRRGNVLKKMGADRVIFPEREMGQRLAQLISNDTVMDILDLPQGFVVEQLAVGAGFSGRNIADLNTTNRWGILVLLVYQNDKPVLPAAHVRLEKGDVVIVFGQKSKMHLFEKENSD